MVHAQESLALSKSHFAQLWMSAHFPKKLKKAEVNRTDVSALVEAVRRPVKPISLRHQSMYLRGIARLYVLQVEYLYKDCNDAFAKLKMTFRKRKNVDLPAGRDRARGAEITLEEKEGDANEITLNFPIAPLGLGGDLLLDDNGSDTASILGGGSDISAEEARRRSFDANQPFFAQAQDIELDMGDGFGLNVPGSATHSLHDSLAGLSFEDMMNCDIEIDVDANPQMDEADAELGEHVLGFDDELKERQSIDDNASAAEHGVGEANLPNLMLSEAGSAVMDGDIQSIHEGILDNALDAMSNKDMDQQLDVDVVMDEPHQEAIGEHDDQPLVLELDEQDMQEDTPPPTQKDAGSKKKKRRFTRDEENRYRKDENIEHSRGWANRRHKNHEDTLFTEHPLPSWIWRSEMDLSLLPAQEIEQTMFGCKFVAPKLQSFIRDTFALIDYNLSQEKDVPRKDVAVGDGDGDDGQDEQPDIADIAEPIVDMMDDVGDEDEEEKDDQPQIFKEINDWQSVVDDHVEPEPDPVLEMLAGDGAGSVDGEIPDPSSFPSFSQGSEFGDDTASQVSEVSMPMGRGQRPRGWSKRTQKTYQYLQKKDGDEFSFFNLMNESRSRTTVSGVFYEMLVLKNHNLIDVEQEEAYGDITISKTEEFHSYLRRNRVFSQSQSG